MDSTLSCRSWKQIVLLTRVSIFSILMLILIKKRDIFMFAIPFMGDEGHLRSLGESG